MTPRPKWEELFVNQVRRSRLFQILPELPQKYISDARRFFGFATTRNAELRIWPLFYGCW